MIDVSQIKDTKELLEMKDDLNFFINKKIIVEIYEEQGREEWELDVDRRVARELLDNVLRRLNQLNRPTWKRDSKPRRRVPSA